MGKSHYFTGWTGIIHQLSAFFFRFVRLVSLIRYRIPAPTLSYKVRNAGDPGGNNHCICKFRSMQAFPPRLPTTVLYWNMVPYLHTFPFVKGTGSAIPQSINLRGVPANNLHKSFPLPLAPNTTAVAALSFFHIVFIINLFILID